MFRLWTLGNADLYYPPDLRHPDGRSVQSVVRRPLLFALMIRLASERGGIVSGDTLRDMFWRNSDPEDSRHSLHEAASRLRSSLPHHLVISQRQVGYGIAVEHLVWDEALFLNAIESGDHEAALENYRGDYLDGFALNDCPTFERWMENRRTYLRRKAVDAGFALLEAHRLRDRKRAVATAHRLLDIAPWEEEVIRHASTCLAEAGDRATARDALHALVERIENIDGDPQRETLDLLAALDRPVPPMVAAIDPMDAPPPPPPPPVETDDPVGPNDDASVIPPARTVRPRVPRWSGLVAALVVLVALGIMNRRSDGTPMAIDERAGMQLHIEAVENYGAPIPDAERFAAAVTAETLGRLAEVPSLVSIPIERGRLLDPDDGPAVTLRAGLASSNGRLRVTALMLDAVSGVALVRTQFEPAATDDLIDLSDIIADSLVHFARTRTGTWLRERALIRSGATEPALTSVRTAIEARARGDSLRRLGSMESANVMFGIADSLLAVAATQAPHWTVPLIERAETAVSVMWSHLLASPAPDLASAERAVLDGMIWSARAIELASDDPAAIEADANLRRWRYTLAPAKAAPDEAATLEAILWHVVDLDPTIARAWTGLGALLSARGAFAEAHWAAKQAHRADVYLQHVGETLPRLYQTALEIEDFADARRSCGQLIELYGGTGIDFYCELTILASLSSVGPDEVNRARTILDEFRDATNAPLLWEPRLQAMAAIVLARDGQLDAADEILRLAVEAGRSDAEFPPLHAWALVHLAEPDSAAAILDRYVSTLPERRVGVLRSRRFRDLIVQPAVSVEIEPGAGG